MASSGGHIQECASQNCGHICCDFAAGNYIALYPGELHEARRAGQRVDHLSTAPDGLGGDRAICRARDTSTCDGGYKPLDCACYPYFPTIEQDASIDVNLKGAKCPLQDRHLSRHRQWVIERWGDLASSVSGLHDWIRHTRLVGYIRPPREE